MSLSPHDGDRVFEQISTVLDSLDEAQLAPFLARLVFLLVDRVGDAAAVLAAIEAATPARS